jgi:hypothetical protein
MSIKPFGKMAPTTKLNAYHCRLARHRVELYSGCALQKDSPYPELLWPQSSSLMQNTD